MAHDRAPRRRRRRWVVGIAALVVGGLAATSGLLVAQRASAADPVLMTTVQRRDVTRSVSGTGTLVDELTYLVAADGSATVAARAGASASGATSAARAPAGTPTVESMDVEPGQRVERGQRLARVQGAQGRGTDVDSPVAGHVRAVTAAVRATAGELVTIGAGRVLAAITISENQIAQVGEGQRVAVTLAAGTATTAGAVDQVEQVPDDSSGALRYTVLVRLDRVPAGARVGMTATGAITTARADDVLAVRAAAIGVRGAAVRVQVRDGGATRTVPARIGLVGDAAVEIRSGLRAGQRVVTGAAGKVAATTRRLGPPSSLSDGGPSAAPTGSGR